MNYHPFFYILFFYAYLSPFQCWSSSYTYLSILNGEKTNTQWTLHEDANKIEVSGQNRGNDVKLKYSQAFDLHYFIEKEPKDQLFEIQREGTNLSVKNQEKVKVLSIGNTPWIQEFKFGFKPFLTSKKQEISFVIVYKKDTTIHDMTATKEKIERIIINEKPYETQKLKITLKGFKKRFWKAEAWFDLETKLLVKYRSNEGPGTPYVEVTLIK